MTGHAPEVPRLLLAAACPEGVARFFPLAFPLLFVASWIAVTTLLAWLGGHMALLARFPPVAEREEERFSWASGKLRGLGVNNALHVGIGRRGLHLALNGLFRPVFSRGVPCIPWHELRPVERRGRGTRLEVPSLGMEIVLFGRAGEAVERKLASLGIARGPAGGRPMVRG